MSWQYGQKAELARRLEMSRSQLHDILSGRRGVSPDMALRIQNAAQSMGLPIKRAELLYPDEFPNPLLDKIKSSK